MRIQRRSFILGAAASSLLLPNAARAWWPIAGKSTPAPLEPGDFGYKHDLYHPFYQRLFAESGKCSCGVGDCRATVWRNTKMDSPIGVDIFIDRQWWPLSRGVYQPPGDIIPAALRDDPAHVCSYSLGPRIPPSIPCVIINLTGI